MGIGNEQARALFEAGVRELSAQLTAQEAALREQTRLAQIERNKPRVQREWLTATNTAEYNQCYDGTPVSQMLSDAQVEICDAFLATMRSTTVRGEMIPPGPTPKVSKLAWLGRIVERPQGRIPIESYSIGRLLPVKGSPNVLVEGEVFLCADRTLRVTRNEGFYNIPVDPATNKTCRIQIGDVYQEYDTHIEMGGMHNSVSYKTRTLIGTRIVPKGLKTKLSEVAAYAKLGQRPPKP